MPLYEYLCRDCEQQVELLVRSASEELECPECNGKRLMKLLSVPAAPSCGTKEPAASPAAPSGGCGSGCGCFPG